MQSKDQKRLVALERIEKRLLQECDRISDNPNMYTLYDGKALRLSNTKMIDYLGQVNNIRRALNMKPLSVDSYESVRGNLIITDGYSQFYPKENE